MARAYVTVTRFNSVLYEIWCGLVSGVCRRGVKVSVDDSLIATPLISKCNMTSAPTGVVVSITDAKGKISAKL